MPDTTVTAVVFEDSAALVGLVLAAGGVIGSQVTGSHLYDGISSILIGASLAYVAFTLGRDNMSLLVGRSVPGRLLDQTRAEIVAPEAVREVGDLAAILLGPDEILVAAKVGFADQASAVDVENAAEQVEQRLARRIPAVRQVFLDPTADARVRSPDGAVERTADPSESDDQ